jgi:MFS superfamily sulfate permease-like transporter
MTAHYRLGARTGAAGVMIGTILVLAGIIGRNSLAVISAIPAAVLGILLLYVGIRHASLAIAELGRAASAAVIASMGIVSYLSNNMLAAVGAGLLVKLVLIDAPAYLRNRQKIKER